MNLFEPEWRVRRILPPKPIGSPYTNLTIRGCHPKQQPKFLGRFRFHRLSMVFVSPALNSARASAAIVSRMPSDFAKDWDQRFSDAISSRRMAARASCSSGGSFVASATALLSAWVIFRTPQLGKFNSNARLCQRLYIVAIDPWRANVKSVAPISDSVIGGKELANTSVRLRYR